jgi:hypothetical protein
MLSSTPRLQALCQALRLSGTPLDQPLVLPPASASDLLTHSIMIPFPRPI